MLRRENEEQSMIDYLRRDSVLYIYMFVCVYGRWMEMDIHLMSGRDSNRRGIMIFRPPEDNQASPAVIPLTINTK
jgi:hypothetical protein